LEGLPVPKLEDKPVPSLDWVPTGTVSLKGKLLLGLINRERIKRWKMSYGVEEDFDLTLTVAFSKRDGKDFEDLKKTLGPNGAIVCSLASAELLNVVEQSEFSKICRQLGWDPEETRIFLDPEGEDYALLAELVRSLIRGEPTELGSFSFDGHLDLKLLEPYKCMEAKQDASVSTKKRVYIS
jgi:hypothetical protein